MNTIKVYGLFLFMIAMIPAQVSGHSIWKPGSITPPRSTHPTAELSVGPCGGTGIVLLPRGKKPKIFKPGEQITVEWNETVNHGGLFIIDFLDEIYMPLIPSNEIQVTDSFDSINANKVNTQQRSQLITMPNIECPNCVLRLLQQAWSEPYVIRPAQQINTVTNMPNWINYYSCSDIRIESTSSMAPGEVTNQKRVNNSDNVVLTWTNPSEIQDTPRNVAYRVLILSDTIPISMLTDGTPYVVGDQFGTATIQYDGNLETATISNLIDTDTLFFKIFTYDVSYNYSAGVMLAATPVVIPLVPIVDLSLSQINSSNSAVSFNRSNGLITATASVSNGKTGDKFSYDWSLTANSVMIQEDSNSVDNKSNGIFVFDPKSLDPGTYDITVSATNTINTNGLTSNFKTLSITIGPQQAQNNSSSGGCSISNKAKFDPLLLLLALLSILVVGFRTRQNR